jgi:hypothetical protein
MSPKSHDWKAMLFWAKVAVFIGLGIFVLWFADRWFALPEVQRNFLGGMLLVYGVLRALIRILKKP